MPGMLQIINPILHPNISGLSGSDPVGYFNYLLPTLITIGFIAAIVIFFFVFIVGAIAWITSGSDKVALENARRRILHGLIGLILLLLIFFILQLMNRIFGLDIGNIGIGVAPTTVVAPTQPPIDSTCSNINGTSCQCTCPDGFIPVAGSCSGAYPACIGNVCSCVEYYSFYPRQQQVYYQFNEGTGTVVSDSSGNTYSATFTDPGDTWSASGCNGSSFHSNGTGGEVQGPMETASDAFKSSPSFTYAAWINRDSYVTGVYYDYNLIMDSHRNMGFGFGTDRPDNLMYGVAWDAVDDGCYGLGSTNSEAFLYSNQTLLNNTWYHVAVTYDSQNQTAMLYVNGSISGTLGDIPSPEAWCNGAEPIAIGGALGTSRGFQGYIDEARIYNYALTPAEINSIYSSCTPN